MKIHFTTFDRGNAFARGMLIDGSLFRDEGIDVGDPNHDLHIAIRSGLSDLDLVQVAGGVVID